MAKDEGAGRYGHDRVGWGFFGSELRRRREAAGFTQQELGRRVICSGSYIGQFETAVRKPQLDVAERIDAELGTDGFFARMCKELIDSSPFAQCFVGAAYLEGLAVTIREHATLFVPGLLQTAAYARAVFLSGFPFAPAEDIDAWVSARLERARILDHPTEPLLWVILSEAVIRCAVGGSAVMSEQLEHIAELAQKRRIGVQVLPFAAGAPAVGGMVSLMTFDDAPPVAYEEGPMTGNLLDDPARVAQAEQMYDLVRTAALPLDASLTLIQYVAKEYASGR
ncbi:helix-turn-helix transcriptional regulator [Streptomyces cinnamoneus]|uniref:helix-turn-helix domain-containing protein n=1 Tax=Streptomyces cinnamoneus TaxID=53446 RepID=UPI00341DB317